MMIGTAVLAIIGIVLANLTCHFCNESAVVWRWRKSGGPKLLFCSNRCTPSSGSATGLPASRLPCLAKLRAEIHHAESFRLAWRQSLGAAPEWLADSLGVAACGRRLRRRPATFWAFDTIDPDWLVRPGTQSDMRDSKHCSYIWDCTKRSRRGPGLWLGPH